MGKDEDEGRRRRREREDEAELEKQIKREKASGGAGSTTAAAALAGDSGALDQLIHEVETQIERVHSLYLQFLSGLERLPPVEARKRLEDLVTKLNAAPKPGPAYRFRATNVVMRFQSYRERWEKSLQDLESGKIRRPTGAKPRR